mmetsp:Transcript_22390/g.35922  ORF Transcript_22390/g.35922 Transcript_22390/m.35922 type:complete len:497 (+) Transcript_22390:54-1544(+)|eukprot:CAMPEP_0202713486 /NCGR_PEP_ID=MMETSP1385-20130828/54822_1 /ASSEMBLY_ACC=CAM_ASM_000861 /TAXON_ID=933848 /ORGANISM="Elphidium margaritaceum" /LENGTH=496 /DNA_ID=CAMNT_0049373847 /DNA_START=40 /DNA_END=1530 /DNA_ORIENTATION=+
MPHVKRVPIETDINIIIQLTTYLGYGILTVLGYARDWISLCMGWTPSIPKGYAPITRDFEEFFRRRLYGRIIDCFNRPITGPAAGSIKCLRREPPLNAECHLTKEVQHALFGGKPLTEQHYTECLNLSSYNYLGFGQPGHKVCEPKVLQALHSYGTSTATAPLYGGNTALHCKLERKVADFLSVEDAMIFGMGWGVNATAIPALVGKGSLIISDAINHNSIVTGARASGAKIQTFPHDDMAALESTVRRAIIEGQPRTHRPWKKILIVVEGVYSMEGEVCDLAAVVEIKKKYNCYLYLDEAHSIGALGKRGRGVCEYAGVDTKDVDILMGTFTKSFGAIGGYIAGSKVLVDCVRQICASQMFSAGLSPPCVAQVLSAFEVIDSEEGTQRIQQLHENSDLMRKELCDAGLYVVGDYGSAVIPMLICQPGKIAYTARLLFERGIAVVVVGFPAVPILFSRIRFCLSANHTKEQIMDAVKKIKEVAQITHLYYHRKLLG